MGETSVMLRKFISTRRVPFVKANGEIRDVSLFSAGGEGHYFAGGGSYFFPSCLGEGHNLFSRIFGRGS